MSWLPQVGQKFLREGVICALIDPENRDDPPTSFVFQELDTVDASGYGCIVRCVTGFVGTEGLDDVTETIHVAHDFRFVEIVFRKVGLHIVYPFIDAHYLQTTILVQPFSRGNEACSIQVETA